MNKLLSNRFNKLLFLLASIVTILLMFDNSNVFAISSNSFSVIGNQIYYANNQKYIPEGISVYGGLEAKVYNINNLNINAQIIAASKYWHANTIRLQVAESNLFKNINKSVRYNVNFLSELVRQVNLAHSLGMMVVINDQTEFTNLTLGPTQTTVRFWSIVAPEFKNDPYVIFDLFNEPRISSFIYRSNYNYPPKVNRIIRNYQFIKKNRVIHINQTKIWHIWEFGGKLNNVKYVGMQTLVNQIRSMNINNLIWIEGPNQARQLPIKNYLLKGSNLVYSIHHPNLNNQNSWAQIAKLASISPVVDGEWAQYQSPWAECFSNAYYSSPIYLKYLKKHNIGIIAWSLQAGSLVKGNAQSIPSNLNSLNSPKFANLLKNPSILLPSYDCGYEFGQGVGQLLQNYFSQNSNPVILWPIIGSRLLN